MILKIKVEGEDFSFEIDQVNFMKGGIIIGSVSGKNTEITVGVQIPENTSLPNISTSTPKVGELITVSNGSWNNDPTSFSYQWKRNNSNIVDANSNEYIPTTDDYDNQLTCTVTATNSFGSASVNTTSTSNVLPANPVNIVLPTITGILQSGETLTCSQGTWSGQGTIVYEYQWLRNGIIISGETGDTYLTIGTDQEKTISCVVTATNSGGSTEITTEGVYITNPSFSRITSNHIYVGTDRMLLYEPPAYGNNSDLYGVLVFCHGNGERGIPVDNNYLAGTGNGSNTGFTGNLNNTNRIIHSSIVIRVNGVAVATGRRGVIVGEGVTGTYSFDVTSSAAFTINFTTPPANGHEVRVYFTQSNLLGQGVFRYLNLGDDPNLLIVAPQISASEGGFSISDHWTAVINYLINNGYRVDLNKLYLTGLSLGGIFGMTLLANYESLTYPFAAFVDAAPGANASVPSSSSSVWSSATNRGKMIIRGSSDGNGNTQLPSAMANGNGSDREFPMFGINYWNIGHSNALWDNKLYNRKNRTDATGLADFDYIDEFLTLFSLDLEEQAELWVSYAESTLESEHYRIAKRQTDNLSAGDTKTELLGRLSTLKTTIGNSVLVDFGTAFYNTTGNYNNINSAAAGTTLSNLVDDEGNNSGFIYTTVNACAATPTIINDIGATRLQGRQFGTPINFMRDGMLIDSAGTTGTLKFGGLNNSKTYILKVYIGASANAWSARAEVEVVAQSTTKFAYCDTMNFRLNDGAASNSYVKFSGLTPSSNEISFTIRVRQTASTERNCYLQGIELIEVD